MSKRKIGLAALGFVAAIAFAGAAAAQGFYVGGSLGEVQYKKTCGGGLVGACDDRDLGWRGFIGYQMHRNWAVEIGYADLGELKANGTFGGIPLVLDARGKAADVSVVGSWYFTERASLFGRLGFSRSQLTLNSTFAGVLSSTSDHSTDFTMGAGLQYDFLRHIGMRVEFQQYDSVGGAPTGEDDVMLISAGIVLRF